MKSMFKFTLCCFSEFNSSLTYGSDSPALEFLAGNPVHLTIMTHKACFS